ncbi:MAG: hypothetical protein SOI56_10455 [Eubacteriales bacterium]|jgi:hypothetical protein
MNERTTLKTLLDGKNNGQHLMPFFWQHGETEETLRQYMHVIHSSGCGAVCVESRPHPDFCGPRWWKDMDCILDEARKMGMKVWILDDSHFPTGFANGALVGEGVKLRRQSLFCNETVYEGEAKLIDYKIKEHLEPMEPPMSKLAEIVSKMETPKTHFKDDEEVLSVTAWPLDIGGGILDLTSMIGPDGVLHFTKPEGRWKICLCGKTHNCGPRRESINMLDADSCRLLIDAVYEKHWEHYAADFGHTIAGFFSDEPELGNGILYAQNNPIGSPQDLPWSHEVEDQMIVRFGERWAAKLPLLWNEKDGFAEFRHAYMDIVTKTVKRDFSEQIGTWCRAHGVQYIGHVIEDEGQHCRTASSLGHYFRGLAGMDMAGIDDIGGQVLPGGEDGPLEGPLGRARGAEFYHYGLAELASSAAAIEPRKKGRSMCEIFGNYGWAEGVKLEKYLADHFLVAGINHFVPHAFSPKAYPDPDCPPHFYAGGHNPQFRHFGKLCRYMDRVCSLIDDGQNGGHHVAQAAVLYHGDSEWSADAMPFEKPLRKLYDEQIFCDVIADDVFAEPEAFGTDLSGGLRVGTQSYQMLVIPSVRFLPSATARAAAELADQGFPVIFVDHLPEGLTGTDRPEEDIAELFRNCRVVSLDELAEAAEPVREIRIEPASDRIRVLHYEGEYPLYMFVNESNVVWTGCAGLPSEGTCFRYDAMENVLRPVDLSHLTVRPLESVIVLFGEPPAPLIGEPETVGKKEELVQWKRSLCRAINYPDFQEEKEVTTPDNVAEGKPEWSGFARYTTKITAEENEQITLQITDAGEGIEVFLNGKSIGIRAVGPMLFDLTGKLKGGENTLTIDVATTLERERYSSTTGVFEAALLKKPTAPTGLCGRVFLYRH